MSRAPRTHYFVSYWCTAGEHNNCQDGAAIQCRCGCHKYPEQYGRKTQ